MISGDVKLRLDQPLLADLHALADAEGCDLASIMTRALKAEIARTRARARTPVRAEERLLAPLRALLARDLAAATGWEDLQTRLAVHGYRLREAGGGLLLATSPGGKRICKASELGFAYSDLMRRFGRPFPGHSQHKLAARILDPMRAARCPLPPEDDDFDLIEPF